MGGAPTELIGRSLEQAISRRGTELTERFSSRQRAANCELFGKRQLSGLAAGPGVERSSMLMCLWGSAPAASASLSLATAGCESPACRARATITLSDSDLSERATERKGKLAYGI